MLKDKTFILLIPARGGSKGIKKKNLKLLLKKPLVSHTIDFAKKLNFIYKISINSDDKNIIKISKKKKVDHIKRKKNLSGDYVSDYDLISSTINYYKKKNLNYDYIIYLQPTSPFRKIKDLTLASKKVIDLNLDTIWSVNKIDNKYNPLKLFKKKGEFLSLYSNMGKKIIARQQLENIYQRNGIFYIFDVKKLIKNKTIYPAKGIFPYLIKYKYVNIDTLNDLKNCRKMFKKWSI